MLSRKISGVLLGIGFIKVYARVIAPSGDSDPLRVEARAESYASVAMQSCFSLNRTRRDGFIAALLAMSGWCVQ